MLRPINDLAKIQLDADEYGFGGTEKDTAESGVLVELPEKFNYFGMWSFVFEVSFMADKNLKKLLEHYQGMLGQRVYWTALAERGNIIQDEKGNRFAFVKLTSLIAADDNPDAKAINIHSDGAGSFKV